MKVNSAIYFYWKIEERHGIKEILDKSDTNPKSKSWKSLKKWEEEEVFVSFNSSRGVNWKNKRQSASSYRSMCMEKMHSQRPTKTKKN